MGVPLAQFKVPDIVKVVVREYFQDIQICFTTAELTTAWQQLEIMTGCTISQFFAMEVIVRAYKWVVEKERLPGRQHLSPIRAYMNEMTTITTTAPCTKRLLDKLNAN